MIIEDETHTFEIVVGGKTLRFAYAFTQTFLRYDPRWKMRSTITFCILRRIPANKDETFPVRDFVGQSVLNPHDLVFDDRQGKAIAFRRACEKFYAAMMSDEPEIPLEPTRGGFWDLCRKARGRMEHTTPIEIEHPPVQPSVVEPVMIPLPLAA